LLLYLFIFGKSNLKLEGHKGYAFLGDNQEGLARDDEGYLYIAQDTG